MTRLPKMLLLAGLVAPPALVAAPAHAQRVSKVSGKALGQMCSSKSSIGMCDAYLSGLMDGEAWAKKYDSFAHDESAPVAFCVPAQQTAPQVRGLVVAWLRAHNDALTEPAGKAVYRALHDTYPCHAASAPAEGQK
ncbi:Rap1a/Tai family immunity protein [Gluconobacter albidus]|uniref:Rap1a/Tai family immunity protein n=1 Tax=Gluconobacter albidus TaxID=318683 RepID=UPI001B8B3E6C|nr:Rap1a/Tai family immunity protein [Gluconobacter albidus]MBS1028846.1 hypothetical protein [Gluconobacter albidus]MCP1274090.1 hypothetical protein [Gluconobacter albidus]